ncbi:MAG: hypothetical protein H6996_12025 [Moraxellaceae bacterium]|nr:hypothetical protein [Moraxellaceae bacterium]
MTISPRSLVLALGTHWDVIECLVQKSREQLYLEPAYVLAIIAKRQPQLSTMECEDILRKLVNSGLLETVARGESLQINSHVLTFVRSLTREHELGLSAVLQARVNAIREATDALNEGVHLNQMDMMRHAAMNLAELFRQISQQLDQDRHAILELAEKAKATDSQLSASHRYRQVLQAYDQYVEPMAQMMDTGAAGTFYRYLENAEHALDHAVDMLTTQGSLYTQRQHIRQVAFAAKALRQLGREVLKHCSDTLLPLREEVRQHNQLSASISLLLGQVRKRGLNLTFKNSNLPLWQRDSPRRVTVGDEVLTIMAEAQHYQPVSIAFPESTAAVSAAELDLVDDEVVMQQLAAQLPVTDILQWLKAHYSHVSDATLLRLYHRLTQNDSSDWQLIQADQAINCELKNINIYHYPQGAVTP